MRKRSLGIQRSKWEDRVQVYLNKNVVARKSHWIRKLRINPGVP
jgi:hypothetical protein